MIANDTKVRGRWKIAGRDFRVGVRFTGLLLLLSSGSGACRLQLLWYVGSVVVHRLSCSLACRIFPGPRIKRMSPPLAGGFFTTEPPGKPLVDKRREWETKALGAKMPEPTSLIENSGVLR